MRALCHQICSEASASSLFLKPVCQTHCGRLQVPDQVLNAFCWALVKQHQLLQHRPQHFTPRTILVAGACGLPPLDAVTTGVGAIVWHERYISLCRYWVESIAQEGLIGIAMSQSPEYVAPHGSTEPIFGTNPIAVGVPTAGQPLVMDLSTAAAAW